MSSLTLLGDIFLIEHERTFPNDGLEAEKEFSVVRSNYLRSLATQVTLQLFALVKYGGRALFRKSYNLSLALPAPPPLCL